MFDLKKIVLTFVFLTLLTTFYGLNASFENPALDEFSGQDSMTQEEAKKEPYVISVYDQIMRRVSDEEGNDWRLMSAIAYHESRFTANVISTRGARGLMQIMPSVARQFDVSQEKVLDPETNVRLANQLLNKIAVSLRLPSEISYENRMSLVLASYNSGIGHVLDARSLARTYGEDPNSWEVVSRYLELKSQPDYYENDVVKCGRFTGFKQTRAFVDDVMSRYDKYCQFARK
ncbi:MAG: transglycosylase SLT domain-containing protein [Alistipes sp.]